MKLLACVAGVIALLAIRSAVNDGFRKVLTAAATDKAGTCLAMLGSTTRNEEGSTYLVGSIRNNCDRKFDHVTIAFKLERSPESKLDLPNAPIFAYSRDVQPGETRQFKTQFRVGKNSVYRFDEITAY